MGTCNCRSAANGRRLERVVEAICDELGLDHAAIVDGTAKSIPPGVRPKPTTLAKIRTENSVGKYAALAGAGIGLLTILAKIAAHFFGVHLE